MAVSANDGIRQVICTGGETEIDFDFELLARADLKVIYNTGGSESTLTLNLQYTIPDESLNDPDGGVITLDAVTYFPDGAIADDVFTLILDPAAERSTDFTPGGTIPYTTLNSEFDRIWQYLQKLNRNIERAPRISETLTGKTVTLSAPVNEHYLRFNGTTGAIEAVSGASIITEEPEFRYSAGYIQWKLQSESSWVNLVEVSTVIDDAVSSAMADYEVITDTTPQLGGDLDTNGKLIEWKPSCGGANLTASGESIISTVDTNSVGIGSVLCFASDGHFDEADADSSATFGLALALETGTGNKKVLLRGFMRKDAWNWTVGGLLYLSTTAGEMTQTPPNGTDDVIQVLGWAYSADVVYFDPSININTHTGA